MKEALQRFAAFATGSASNERLFYGPVDNRLLRGSFNRYGRPHPELRPFFDSTNDRLKRYCSASLERPRKSLKFHRLAI